MAKHLSWGVNSALPSQLKNKRLNLLSSPSEEEGTNTADSTKRLCSTSRATQLATMLKPFELFLVLASVMVAAVGILAIVAKCCSYNGPKGNGTGFGGADGGGGGADLEDGGGGGDSTGLTDQSGAGGGGGGDGTGDRKSVV